MNTIQANRPSQVENRIVSLIEQMMDVVSKGTALGLCDLISAMFSGYFIESGGAVMPAVEAFLRQEVEDEKERAARSRRAAKALTYGSYNLNELIDKLREIVEEEGVWEPIVIQGVSGSASGWDGVSASGSQKTRKQSVFFRYKSSGAGSANRNDSNGR